MAQLKSATLLLVIMSAGSVSFISEFLYRLVC